MKENMGVFLQEIRKGKGLTQKELAEQIGVSDKTISKWENGNSEPDTSMLLPLCKALDITVNELLSCERILPENYSTKAEETIMALIEENKRTSKRNFISVIIGGVVVCVGLFLLAITNAGLSFPIMFYLDMPSLIVLTILETGVVLLSGARSVKKVLHTVNRTVIPVGLLVAISSLVIVFFYTLDMDLSAVNSGSLVVVILPVLYSVFVKIVTEILLAKEEQK